MFDARSLLESLARGAQPASSQQGAGQQGAGQQGAGGGLGGLGDILGQILQGRGGQAAGHPQSADAGGGGLADILGQLQRGLTQQGGATHAPGGGGLGDILGQLQAKLGQASSNNANEAPGAGAGAGGGIGDILAQIQSKLGSAGAGAGGGGLADILGQVLSQATHGVKEGAGRLDQATGASEALGKATGQNPSDILARLQEMARANPMAAGTAAAGLGGVMLGTHTGRAMAASVAKIGALALIGGLAYKAFQNYQGGKPLITAGTPLESAPAGSGFEAAAVTNEAATLYIRAMIAAAAADGRIDDAEQARIIGSLKQAGLDDGAEEFLANELNNPATVEDLAGSISTPEEAIQLYTAARIAIDPDERGEQQFLAALGAALGIDAKLAQHIEASARTTG